MNLPISSKYAQLQNQKAIEIITFVNQNI